MFGTLKSFNSALLSIVGLLRVFSELRNTPKPHIHLVAMVTVAVVWGSLKERGNVTVCCTVALTHSLTVLIQEGFVSQCTPGLKSRQRERQRDRERERQSETERDKERYRDRDRDRESLADLCGESGGALITACVKSGRGPEAGHIDGLQVVLSSVF